MAKVRHPNLLLFIAAVLDMPNRSDPIIITELLDTDLRKAYQNNQLANNRVRLFILRDVAAALNYLHLQREPIIHRDVSSANVLLQALARQPVERGSYLTLGLPTLSSMPPLLVQATASTWLQRCSKRRSNLLKWMSTATESFSVRCLLVSFLIN